MCAPCFVWSAHRGSINLLQGGRSIGRVWDSATLAALPPFSLLPLRSGSIQCLGGPEEIYATLLAAAARGRDHEAALLWCDEACYARTFQMSTYSEGSGKGSKLAINGCTQFAAFPSLRATSGKSLSPEPRL